MTPANMAEHFVPIFGNYISTPAWICLAISVAAAVIALLTRFIPIWKTARVAKAQDPESDFLSFENAKNVPMVSVIVYTISTEDILLEYLDKIMNQDYPDYEVILVNEGGYEVTASLAERLQQLYPERLYVTFIPPESHNLSRRKLAQTVGMKAAKGEIVLTTSSNCIIPSNSWLSLMMQPFGANSDTDIVLGYSHIEFDNLHGIGKWYKEFDSTLTACQWIGAAVNHHPYRGDGFNLAFRKRLFFEQKGYSKTLHLKNGDDDLFINEIATSTNTDVMISRDAILTYDWGESGNRVHSELKDRYRFTSRLLPKAPFLKAGAGSLMQWVCVASAVTGAVIELPDLLPAAVALGIILIFNITEILIYRKAARALGSVCLWWSLPIFLLWHPVANWLSRPTRQRRRKNFTLD